MAESPPPPPGGPPPGWYPDPERPDAYRWWDGMAWADQQPPPTSPAPQHPGAPADPGHGPGPGAGPPMTGFAPPPDIGGYPGHPGAYPAPPAPYRPLGDIGSWFSESFRLAVDRSGHFLPMIVVFVLSVGLFTSFALWYGLEDSTFTVDQDTAETSVSYGGSSMWLILAALSVPVSSVLTGLAKGAMALSLFF
ncbi:MAG: DUF2510 domain-containing protein, partial [Actinomycetota bacterium]